MSNRINSNLVHFPASSLKIKKNYPEKTSYILEWSLISPIAQTICEIFLMFFGKKILPWKTPYILKMKPDFTYCFKLFAAFEKIARTFQPQDWKKTLGSGKCARSLHPPWKKLLHFPRKILPHLRMIADQAKSKQNLSYLGMTAD